MVFPYSNTLAHDLKYALRIVWKNPAFSLTVVLLLAVGIGANTTMFSVVNAVLIEPLPFGQPDRLVRLWESNPGRGWPEFAASVPNFHDWQKQQSVFEELAAVEMATFNLTGAGEPERIAAASVTANFASTLGIAPVLGRGFLPAEEVPGNNHVVLLSYGLWQRQFAGDPSTLNKTIQLNRESYTVVGIMPPGFQFPRTRELWVPLAVDVVHQPWRADRGNRNLQVFGRLKPEVTFSQASAEMGLLAERLEKQYPDSNAGWGVRLRTFYDWMVPEPTRKSMLMLFVAVGLVLLIACANVASLLLARGRTRMQETAIRSALGASRARVVQQLLVESAVLAGLGGLGGLLLAFVGTRLIAASQIQNIARLSHTQLDGRALAFTLITSVITGLFFGLAPAFLATPLSLTEKLKEGDRSDVGRLGRRLGRSLVVTEVALAMALLVSAGLMVRSFARLRAVPLGFAPDNVLTMQISLPPAKYGDREARVDFFDRVLDRLRNTPGVLDASAMTQPPSSGTLTWVAEITLEGGAATVNGIPLSADALAVTPHYFSTFGIPVLQGRDFVDIDRNDKVLNLIVNETFARRYWPGENPIGKRFRPGANNPFGTVIGVAGDVRSTLQEEPRPAFYFPYGYIGMPALVVAVRTATTPELYVATFRGIVRAVDNEQPVYNIRTMDQILSSATAQPRFQTVLLGLFSTVALLLATVGIYSVMAFLVRQRTREIGVRMALGAGARDILNMVLRQGMGQVSLGILLGLLGCMALTGLLRSLVFGVTATDPATLISAVFLLMGVALVACYVPARRAARIDPAMALRGE